MFTARTNIPSQEKKGGDAADALSIGQQAGILSPNGVCHMSKGFLSLAHFSFLCHFDSGSIQHQVRVGAGLIKLLKAPLLLHY